MIHVRRSSVEPTVLTSRIAKAERLRLHRFFTGPRARRSQRRYSFRDELWLKTFSDLRKQFRGKCAYCESHLDKSAPTLVDHFRPLGHAKDLDGTSSATHYWWLAYAWSNLYPVCAACQKAKATLFPVEHTRAPAGAVGKDLASEGALLLDPCVDDPEAYLLFHDGGYVKPRPLDGSGKRRRNTRAEVTIDALALNRRSLVEARAREIESVHAALAQLGRHGRGLIAAVGSDRAHPVNRVKDQLKPWFPHLAARRAAARSALNRMGEFGRLILGQLPELAIGSSAKRAVARRTGSRQRRTAYVTGLSIKNFKGIPSMKLAFDDASSSGAPGSSHPITAGWKVVLGENGTGKTSILQALALALAGEVQAQRHLLINPDKILRRTRGRLPRPKSGFVRVTLNTGDEIELRFTNRASEFTKGAQGAQTFLRAYGPTRNLPVTRAPASWKSVEATARIINLFDASSPFCSAERWLANLKPRRRFDAVALALKDLLRLGPHDHFRRVSRHDPFTGKRARVTVVDVRGATVALDELSDGYQSMIALAVDIMAGLPKTSTDFRSDTGIVLIDELGNHLHPRWRMEVVSSLQRAFPRLQFIATTHEPLCLRGLAKGEVAVMRLEGRTLHVETDLPSPAQLRVDQLLTSKFFGLHSTIDSDTEQKFARYYKLLAKRTLTESEDRERRALSVELTGVGVLGDTRRDQLVYEIIDQYIAREPKLAETADTLREETKRKALARWNDLAAMAQEPR